MSGKDTIGDDEKAAPYDRNDPHALQGPLKHIGGSQSDNWNDTLMCQTVQTLWLASDDKTRGRQYSAALTALKEIGPQDEIEALIAGVSLTYLPGFSKYIFTASRDGDDMFGCADHAIGVAERHDGIREPARKIITAYWRAQLRGWRQARWESCFGANLIDRQTAIAWADEVWGKRKRQAENELCLS
jgi:hypothetical protein